jgi:type I restriction enzyme M protein
MKNISKKVAYIEPDDYFPEELRKKYKLGEYAEEEKAVSSKPSTPMTNTQEQTALFSQIYKIATDLVHAGHVAEWDFKSYVLGTMFYRYISENLTQYINGIQHEAGIENFDYAKMSDEEAATAREALIQSKGFFLLPSELFCNVLERASTDPNLNETLERIFKNIESSAKGSPSEKCFDGLFDDYDVNARAIGETVAKRNKVLVELLNGVAKMPLFSANGSNPDLLGDAYEYLMSMYAANAGKKGGQYFTPADVSELLTRLGTIGKDKVNKVYDPACGSGSLLLKARKVLGEEGVTHGYFGQEIDLTTYNLARINMFLHNIEFDKFDIAREDTLLNPVHWDDQPFELIVSNPPFSVPWEGDKNPLLINDPRFSPAGVLAPAAKGDMAFIMHSLSWLASNGAAAIVCFPGIMYRSGAEQKIRKYLIDNNYIDAIIQLPSNLFLNVTISVDIMLLKKNKTDNSVLFVDASNEFIKATKNNRLTEDNINRIVSAVAERKDIVHFCQLVSNDEIGSKENNYNLSVSTYVEPEDNGEKVDIVKLNAEIEEIVARENVLRAEINKIIAEIEV